LQGLNGQVEPIPRAPSINFGLPLEETDLDFEQLQEVELEAEGDEGCDALRGNDDNEALRGTWVPFRRKFTGKYSASITVRRVKKYLEIQDLYRIPLGHRGELYRYFEMLQNERMLKALRAILKEYKDTVDSIRSTKVIGIV
jgi:helicase required for RNAi-mediated heterochromatin assembly 1